jgi:hypothetical protein
MGIAMVTTFSKIGLHDTQIGPTHLCMHPCLLIIYLSSIYHIITISHKPYMIASHVYYYKHALGDIGKLYFLKMKRIKYKHLKLVYLSNYFLNLKKA